MTKKISCFLVGLFMAVIITLSAVSVGNVVNADTTKKQFTILSTDLSALNLTTEKIGNSPVDDSNGTIRLPGKSFIPSRDKNEITEYVDDELDLTNIFAETNIYGTTLSNMYMSVWVYFGSSLLKDLTIGFTNDDASVSIKWTISADALETLLARTPTDEEYLFFGENIPYGWNCLYLPFSNAVKIGEITANIVGEENVTLFNLTKMIVKQDESKIANCPLKIYDVKFIEGSLSEISCPIKNKAVYISFKSDAFAELMSTDIYTNEYISFPTAKEVFSACYIDDENYLESSDLTNKFKLRVDIGSGEPILYEFGSGNFKVRTNSITLKPSVLKPNTDNTYLDVKYYVFKASDYGSGVWFLDKNISASVGEIVNIKYTIHKAFADADINFESANSEVLEIVDIDRVNQVVKIKALKKGTANIVVTVNDARLEDTDFAESGLTNNVTINVKQQEKTTNGMYIFFIICLCLIVAVGGYFGIKSIIQSRKMEVK